jgi:phosphatidylinositol alpha-1,6-mannosyltransferase
VHFLEFVPEEKLPDLYQISDLFVMCTREEEKDQNVEGFGLVFLEAQACGTPVVGTRHGGIPDAVEHGNGGWLIEENDSTALSQLLAKLVAKPEYFEKEGEKARRRVEQHFTWEQYLNRLKNLCDEAGIDL